MDKEKVLTIDEQGNEVEVYCSECKDKKQMWRQVNEDVVELVDCPYCVIKSDNEE